MAYVPDPYACPGSGWIFYLHGDNRSGFSVYLPGQNEWYPAEPIGPGSDNVSCFRGRDGQGDRKWWWYNVPSRACTEKLTPLHQYGGSAICYDGTCLYAEFGYSRSRGAENQRFYRYTFTGSDGSQGWSGRSANELAVTVASRGQQRVFRAANARPGNVTLTVHDATGRVRFRTQTIATGPAAELTWNTAGVGSGVYVFTVENGQRTAAGRLPVVK